MRRSLLAILSLLFSIATFSQTSYYVNDNSTTNDILTTAVGNNTNSGSQSAPYATLGYAVSQASEGDIIYVDAGIYIEQVTIDKGITLIGAGSGITIVLKPAVINPPPGPFTEPGTIQSAQNIGDVHIRDMSVTGDDNGVPPIVLQTGGSVKYCRLINGSQGIFFRVDPAIKTAVIENNYISVASIGINCQGSGLTATLTNNTIDLHNPGFAAGVFAGLDFGPLVRFTAFGNLINNYNYVGFLANSYNTNITQNSILGTGQHAIEQSTNSLAFATCNWFGTTNAGTIASKVSGFFSFTPYLTNGTNSITNNGSAGFVPVAGSCGEGVNNFYVNDNSRTNDVFTTAVGSNVNTGTSSAPFATLSYAISVAPANSVIHVDAGTYAEQVIIDRAIVINGAGRELTNFVKPASTLVPALGSFTEIGLFETTQAITGDVHIRNISVNSVDGSSQNIIIQSGGSVKNCKLLNGGQGVFFRYPSGSKNVAVEYNIIQPTGIGINCQGAGLTANIVNNTISKTGGFYSGIFAGQDFGPVYGLTIINNSISDYFGSGMLVNSSNNSNITNNSIVGTQGPAIEQGGGMRLNATCNWYGAADPNLVVPKIVGNINYSPWLTNGTDNNVALGFQPLPDVCNGRQNKFYVNDNDVAGDVFTTAVGNNSNSGSPSSPLATIANALSRAQTGDIIIVDAGTYIEQVNINKAITIRGAGMGVTILNGPNGVIAEQPNTGVKAIIQSDANLGDVVIESLTIDGTNSDEQYCIFIQASGKITNCEMRNSTNGFLFRDLSGTARTVAAGNNYIHNIQLIGGFFAGNGLQATATANVIDLNNAVYGMALLAGDRGPATAIINSFTATNNSIINHNGFGILVSTTQSAQIHNNSITGTSGYSIEVVSAAADATCNWFGSAALQNFINKISSVTGQFTPWLTNGTDNDPAIGFQPVPNSCNGLPLAATVDSYTNVTCYGANNGSINITVSGGAAPYNFAWTKDGDPTFSSVTEDPTNLLAGTYHAAITDALGTNILLDANGNIFSINILITEPSLLTATATGNNALCYGNSNGSASVTGVGGKAPYTYLWSNGATTQSISGLVAATYSVTITDANSCIAIAEYTVAQPAQLTATVTGTTASCNGSASASVSGGIIPYTYLWNNGATTASINNVPAGVYSVIVKDANDCTVSNSFTITGNSPINPTATVVNVSCFGASNGMITVTGAGGTAPHTYNLNGSAFQVNNIFSNLPAGSYVVGVKDANGCSDFVIKTITQPALLVVVLDSMHKTCSGVNGGRIYITVSGGSGAKTYNWTGPNGYTSTAQDAGNLAAGDYSVIVTDSKGCTTSLSATLASWPPITISEVVTNVACKSELNGAIDVTVTGGTGSGFTFAWSGSGILPATEDINGLKAGLYTLKVTDAGSGCFVQKRIQVTEPAVLNVTAPNPPSITACGGSTVINATVTGGTAPYEYSLDGGSYQGTNIFNIFTPGVHVITVRDAHGCTKTISKTVLDTGADIYGTNNSKGQSYLISTGTAINARIAIATDVADWFKFTTGTAGIYTLSLNHPSISYLSNLYSSVNNSSALTPVSTTATTKEYNLNGNATYYVQVTGALSYNCYSLLISAGAAPAANRQINVISKKNPISPTVTAVEATVYPNPHQGAFNLQISSPEESKAIIQIITSDGKIIISKDVSLQKGNFNIIKFKGIYQSILFYRVIINNKSLTGKIIGAN